MQLDFQARQPASVAGWLLLVAGLLSALLVAGMGYWLSSVSTRNGAELRGVDAQLRSRGLVEAPRAAGSPASNREEAARLAEMRQISAQMKQPWDNLFAMLENQSRKDVALLELAPDARKKQLRISAEARDLAAMLAFHRSLEQSDELSDVSLLNHEVMTQQAERPIRFNLLANWEVRDARAPVGRP
nr:pilus assembly protein [Pseudomonas insulae]